MHLEDTALLAISVPLQLLPTAQLHKVQGACAETQVGQGSSHQRVRAPPRFRVGQSPWGTQMQAGSLRHLAQGVKRHLKMAKIAESMTRQRAPEITLVSLLI